MTKPITQWGGGRRWRVPRLRAFPQLLPSSPATIGWIANLCYSWNVDGLLSQLSGSSPKQGATLNRLGVVVLVLGLTSACLVFWIGQRRIARQSKSGATTTTAGDWQDGTLSVEDSKKASRDVEMYYGKIGFLMVRLSDWWKRPESKAIVLATASTLIAAGCFFAARRLSPDASSPS
ncbi:MAG: hypothetical protein ABSH21_07290 [Verrucomicrobiia bacterium]